MDGEFVQLIFKLPRFRTVQAWVHLASILALWEERDRKVGKPTHGDPRTESEKERRSKTALFDSVQDFEGEWLRQVLPRVDGRHLEIFRISRRTRKGTLPNPVRSGATDYRRRSRVRLTWPAWGEVRRRKDERSAKGVPEVFGRHKHSNLGPAFSPAQFQETSWPSPRVQQNAP